MAPGSSNNQNNNRQTGTKPKSKSSKKNSVPQEIVAPTRRDQLQQQLNVLVDWANVSGASSVVPNNNSQQQQQQQHFSGVQQPSTSGQQQGQNILLKPRNNRTPGEGTCYEIDNLSLQDNSRYIPVRPIVRRNLLNEGTGGEQSEPHNTAVGVVIPTTPNSALQQTFRLNEGASASGSGVAVGSTHSINNLLHSGSGTSTATGVVPKQQHILNPLLLLQQQQNQAGQTRSTSSPLSYRVPDGASQNQLNLNKNSNHHQQQQQQQNQHLLTAAAVPSTSTGSRYGSATLPFNSTSSTVEDTLNQIQEYIKLTTNLISSVQIDNLNGGPRPQSVQSISTNQSTTPVPPSASCDELRYRMESQSKNMQALKEQQAHLLRLQQAARQQLQEMESIRQMHTASVAPPIESFQTVEQVQDGIGSIMERMRVLSTFIQNQQELSNMLGPDNDTDVLADQAMLQQKFQELRDKKSQMHNLVSELQNLNLDANRQFDGEPGPEAPRNVPIELTHAPATAADARNATKIFLNGGGSTMEGTSSGPVATVEGMSVPSHRPVGEEQRHNGVQSSAVDEDDDEGPLNEEEASVLTGTADMLNEKINEINAMKSQLRRLKEMMDTVKLIEMKTGQESIDEEDEYEEEDAPEDEEEGDDEDEEGAAAIAMQQQQQQQQQRSSRSRSRSMSSAPITLLPNGTTIPNDADGSEMSHQEREHLNKRVEALQAMTQDLREQAKSIAAERDRLKHARNDLHKRRNNVLDLQQQAQSQASEKLTNHVASFVSMAGPSGGRVPAGPKERQQMELKAELEQKKRELERIEKMTQTIKKNTELARSSVVEGVSSHEQQVTPLPKATGPSSVVSSSVESCSGGGGSHHRGTPSTHVTIPPAPAPSAISGSLQNNTAGSNATNDSKTNSADSGVTSDIFAHAQLESASYQSSSTRSFPPPMPDICNRNAATDRYRLKRSDLDADGAPAGGGSGVGGGPGAIGRDHRGSSPWPVFGTSAGAGGLSSSNTGPHSPHYGLPYGPGMHDLSHHATAAGYVGAGGVGAYGSSWSTGGGPYGVATNLLPPHAATPNTPPDPIVFQHIMQTQQMLMNSITQCNQLLWIQQREINNLNNAVLLLQERILGTNSSLLLHENHGPPMGATLIRAESTPPNASNVATTASSIYTRARSEQPMMSHQQQSSPYHHHHSHLHATSHPSQSAGLLQQQQQQPMQSYTQPPYSPLAGVPQNHPLVSPQQQLPPNAQCLANQQMQRNNTNSAQAGLPPSGAHAGRLRSSVRPLNINTLNNALYDDQSGNGGGGGTAGGVLNGAELSTGMANDYGAGSIAPNMINNLCSSGSQPATPTPAGTALHGQQHQHHHHQPSHTSTIRFGQNYNNNLNNTVNNNLSNANMQNNHNLYNQQQDSSTQQQQQQQTQALNNQVLPGVRANNYWDNFRSYSRQNLLSSNSCKSNEESCSQSGSAGGGSGSGGGGASGVTGGCSGSGGTGVGGGGSSAGNANGNGSGSGCNTINNQLQRNNSNASNQYMNNQSNKYQQSINITRNNSLSNANQANSSGLCQDLDSSGGQPLLGYHPNQEQPIDDGNGQIVDHHRQQHQGQHQQIPPQQQQHSHHAPLNQSNSLDLGELQFHTNPINLGLANKTHPKASGHKKYPLSLRSCRDAGAGGEGSSGCYVSGGGDMNLASTCTYQHDSK
uniref:Pericentriolar material 1 protein C-terminal domain-containing protein n=1 Tax=Anopheles culicifacies TaxID=139723 RepID=A0A182MW90_9DIPT